jgi:hypothetical protein
MLGNYSKYCLVGAGYRLFFHIFCRHALYLCFRHAGTARDRGQLWAVACLDVKRCSIYPVAAGKDPCISFLDSSSNHIPPAHILNLPIPVAAGSNVWAFGRSPAGIVGSNPGGVWMCVSCECCVWSGRGLCSELITQAEESY